MNVHRFTLDELPRAVLPLGKQGEDMATRIEVDVRPWLKEHPEATISLIATMSNGTQYTAQVEVVDGFAVWNITESDTILSGYGWAEWKMDCPEGNTYISRKGRTHLYPSAEGEGAVKDVSPYWGLNLKNGKAVHSLRSTGAAEETDNYKLGEYASAFGRKTKARGRCSHAEGYLSETISGDGAHAEGWETSASSVGAHSEGYSTYAQGFGAHAEGQNTNARASAAHAEGESTIALGLNSHAEGLGTIAHAENQHAQGAYNIRDTDGKYLHIIGNGTADNARSNAHTLDKQGNAWFAGDVEGDGFIVASPDGTRWKLTVNNSGALAIARA